MATIIVILIIVSALIIGLLNNSKSNERINQLKDAANDMETKLADANIQLNLAKAEKELAEKRILELTGTLTLTETKLGLVDYIERQEALNKVLDDLKESIEIARKEASAYQDKVILSELGVHDVVFEYATQAEYKIELARLKERIQSEAKDMLKLTQFESETISKYGIELRKSSFEKLLKSVVKAFNIEANDCIKNVKWNNISKMEQRIIIAAEKINDIHSEFRRQPLISQEMIDLRLEELRLSYEAECKKTKDQEEQKIRNEELREELRAEAEIKAALKKAEEKENAIQRLIERESQKLKSANESELTKALAKIKELQVQLELARMDKERAMSMAQQTKKGYVYIISNVGSFGEDVCKIGCSRRLDPTERVKELGDASVPFPFDIHAMIYCDDAPGLEHKLHKKFEHQRVNMTTSRKEFFRLTAEEIENALADCNITEPFNRVADAQQYWETKAILAKEEIRAAVNS